VDFETFHSDRRQYREQRDGLLKARVYGAERNLKVIEIILSIDVKE